MSLFVAIVPSTDAVEDLSDRVQRMQRDPLAASIRWQAPQQWHVTMAFLGDPPDEAEEVVAQRLDAVSSAVAHPPTEPTTPPPSLNLIGAGCFGRQILWVGVSGVTETDHRLFDELAGAVTSGLRRDHFSLDRRPWHPHLTVGRTRGSDARPVAPLLASYVGPPWPISELLAIRSEGGPRPRHTIVHRAPLSH
jgi:2'-5' RNA ligase